MRAAAIIFVFASLRAYGRSRRGRAGGAQTRDQHSGRRLGEGGRRYLFLGRRLGEGGRHYLFWGRPLGEGGRHYLVTLVLYIRIYSALTVLTYVIYLGGTGTTAAGEVAVCRATRVHLLLPPGGSPTYFVFFIGDGTTGGCASSTRWGLSPIFCEGVGLARCAVGGWGRWRTREFSWWCPPLRLFFRATSRARARLNRRAFGPRCCPAQRVVAQGVFAGSPSS